MDDPVSEGGRVSRTNTREEILREAARLFAVVGYKATSLTDIASAVGCSKATLLYHFESKDAIFVALVEPAHRQLQDLAARLATLAAGPAREAAIVGFVDLVLTYRGEIALIYNEIFQLFQRPAFAPLKPAVDALVAAFAGRSGDPADEVAAGVVLAGIVTMVVDRIDDAGDLRDSLIRVARRALVTPVPQAED
jgi:AcrR family transcriptional regulator